MPKYWVKNYFAHESFPEVGQKQKTEREKERKRRERLNDGNNNGQLLIETPPRVAHAKPPGPKHFKNRSLILCCHFINKTASLDNM